MNKRKFYVDGLERTKSISIASIVCIPVYESRCYDLLRFTSEVDVLWKYNNSG